jgi:hypothetical protein
MHKQLVQTYLTLGKNLKTLEVIFRIVEAEDRNAVRTGPVKILAPDEQAALIATLTELREVCGQLGLKASKRLFALAVDSPPETNRELEILQQAMIGDLEGQLFLFVPQPVAQYYEWDEIVTEAVITAFPKASEEIRLSGTCLAAGLNTACVFHAMRAAEIGARALGSDLSIKIKSNKPIELAEWREILDGLSTAIRDFENLPNSTPDKEPKLHFYSEAAAQFRFFKNGWRVRVAHARATYTEPQAREAIDHVRSFFETLAERLKEPPS